MGFLDSIKKGKIKEPVSILLYGVDGVGKSQFASEAPDPIFLGAEQGTSQLDVARLPHLETFQKIIDKLKEGISEKELPFKTFVIDSLDWLEPIIWEHVRSTHPKKPKTISDIGYQKGYEAAVVHARHLIQLLMELKAKHNINLVFIAHARIRTFQDPALTSNYDRYQLALRDDMANIWRQFVDAVLFANYEISKVDDEDRFAFGKGDRVIYTEERPSFQAKNRYGLPFKIPMVKGETWKTMMSYIDRPEPIETPASLLVKIEELRKAVPQNYKDANPGFDERASKLVADAGTDLVKLKNLKDRLQAIVGGAS